MFKMVANLVCVIAVAVGAASLSSASAQETLRTCGAIIETNVYTRSEERKFTSTAFVDIFERTVQLGLGEIADCVFIVFTAESACQGAPSSDLCYIRALDNGQEMLPVTRGTRVFDSNSQTPSMRTVTFVSRGLVKGTHTFKIQVRVGKPGTTFQLDDSTVQVQLTS